MWSLKFAIIKIQFLISFATHSLYYIYPVSTVISLLCILFPWIIMNYFFKGMKNWFILFYFRNFGISLIKMKPATQPGILVSSLQWKGGHFLWISFIYKGLILAFLMMVPRKLCLYCGMRSNCMSSKGGEEGYTLSPVIILYLLSLIGCSGTLLNITTKFGLNSWQ